MLPTLMQYSVAAVIVYVAIGFVLMSLATVLGSSHAIKAHIPKASASATAISLLCAHWVI